MQSGEVSLPLLKKTNGDFDTEKLLAALAFGDDLLDRAQIPYVVLGTIAYQMRNNLPLCGHKVVLGILQRYAIKECTSLLGIIDPKIETLTDGYKTTLEGVPIFIKIVPKDYPTLMNPDIVFYAFDCWRIPNPFDSYWNGSDHYDR